MLEFPNSGGGRSFVRYDGRNGAFLLSSPDGEAPEVFPMRDKILVADIKRAEQGWLKFKDGVDWQPLDAANAWGGPPSRDHNAAVQVDVYCAAWPDPQIRQLRGSSKALIGFVKRLDAAAAGAPDDKAVTVRIGAARITKIGQGTSAEASFEVAPPAKWLDRSIFDETEDNEEDDDARVVDFAPPAPAKSAWDDLEDETIPF